MMTQRTPHLRHYRLRPPHGVEYILNGSCLHHLLEGAPGSRQRGRHRVQHVRHGGRADVHQGV